MIFYVKDVILMFSGQITFYSTFRTLNRFGAEQWYYWWVNNTPPSYVLCSIVKTHLDHIVYKSKTRIKRESEANP